MSYDLVTLRTALIITLSILVVAMIVDRLRKRVFEKSVPALLHAELLSLEVIYHPSRLHMVIKLPGEQRITTRLLDEAYATLHSWPEGSMGKGVHVLERELPPLENGLYYLELATSTQRTVRQFRLK